MSYLTYKFSIGGFKSKECDLAHLLIIIWSYSESFAIFKYMNFKVYGFTLLRNGIKYDYPFIECLQALTELCEESFIALGDSEDGTEKDISNFKNLKVIPTVWDMSLMGDGGQLLSQQTNVALGALREAHADEDGAWGFYLQTDELIHEKDFEQIKRDIEEATKQGCDAIRFRYYHFWLNHNQIAISKRWYPQEVRCIKLNSGIISHGDAQGFIGQEKVYDSDVHIFHYGHVRDEEKREAKQELLIKLIRPGEKYDKYKSREEKAFKKTETLPYYGPHPKWMKERIERFGDVFKMPKKDKVSLYDPKGICDEDLKSRIQTEELEICSSKKRECLSLEPSFLSKLGLGSQIPKSMKSPFARDWSEKQRLEFLLWSKGIST